MLRRVKEQMNPRENITYKIWRKIFFSLLLGIEYRHKYKNRYRCNNTNQSTGGATITQPWVASQAR